MGKLDMRCCDFYGFGLIIDLVLIDMVKWMAAKMETGKSMKISTINGTRSLFWGG